MRHLSVPAYAHDSSTARHLLYYEAQLFAGYCVGLADYTARASDSDYAARAEPDGEDRSGEHGAAATTAPVGRTAAAPTAAGQTAAAGVKDAASNADTGST